MKDQRKNWFSANTMKLTVKVSLVLLFIAILMVPPSSFAQQIITPTVYCLGNCPTDPAATPTAAPITIGSTEPASPTTKAATNTPIPTIDPCARESSSGIMHHKEKHKKKFKDTAGGGVIEKFLQYFIKLIEQFFKLIGGTPPSGPAPTLMPTQQPYPTGPVPTTNPCGVPSQPSQTPTPVAKGPTVTIQPSTCVGQIITPATNVQSVVSSAPENTTFCFSPGTYASISISPKSGQVFDGQNRGAILDGKNSMQYAFQSTVASNVTIKGFVIQNYNTPSQKGTIQSHRTTGWTIANNHVTRNASTGIATENGVKVLNNKIDYNKQQGYSAHGENILYEGNEIAYNNADLAIDATWEAGGGKAWETKNAVFRNNHVHHNGGNGLWDDTNNIYITYDGNNVHDNWGAGIYHEIGYDAKIINNTVTNNGTSTAQGGGQNLGWLWNAGIQLRGSGALTAASPILISGNKVINNYNGITLLESPASGCTNKGLNEGAYGPCLVQNILVQNNEITMDQGATGAVQDGAGNAVFTSRNVKFVNNTYKVKSTHPNDGRTSGWFAWMNSWPNWTQWQGYGHDSVGSYTQN